MDVGDDTAASDGGLDQGVELLVTTDGKLEMAGGDTLHAEIARGVAGKLENLSANCGVTGRQGISRDFTVHCCMASGVRGHACLPKAMPTQRCPARSKNASLYLLVGRERAVALRRSEHHCVESDPIFRDGHHARSCASGHTARHAALGGPARGREINSLRMMRDGRDFDWGEVGGGRRGLTVLADGSHVHSGGGADTAVAGHAGLKVTVDTTDGELRGDARSDVGEELGGC